MVTDAQKIAAFDAVGDRTRFKLLTLMKENPNICVSELAGAVQITTAGASQHLKILEQSGVLVRTRDGPRICYRLNESDPFVMKLMTLLSV